MKKNNKKILMYEIFGILIVFCLIIFIYKRNNSVYLNDVKSNMSNPITITKTCKAGEYLSGNNCLKCRAGSYCNNNKSNACPAGKGSSPGSQSYYDCMTCSAGYYSTGDGAGCRKCSSNLTSNLTSNSSHTGCVPATGKVCDPGYYREGTGCVKCPLGFSSREGATKKEQCYGTVPAGKYIRCTSTGCELRMCPDNTVNPNAQHVNWSANLVTFCTSCGEYRKADSKHVECKLDADCEKGEYFDGEKCTICPAGNYCNNSSKFSCPAGTGSSEGKSASSECTPCDYRYYSTGDGTGCHRCNAPLETNNERTKCEQKEKTSNCKAGEYLKNSQCVACPTGFTSPAGASDIKKCYRTVPAGKYLYCVYDNCELKTCQGNTYSIEKTVNFDAPTTGCTSCPAGTTVKPNHDDCYNYNEQSDGTVCPANTYLTRNENNETVCRKCPNLFSSFKGSTSITDCYMNLEDGKYLFCNYDSCHIYSCQGNTYSEGGKVNFKSGLITNCPICPEKTKSNANHSGCDPDIKCNAGEYLANGTCVKCPTYFTSDVGAVGANQCYTTVEAGKKIDCSGANCVISSCGENEYSTTFTFTYSKELISICYKCKAGEKVNDAHNGCVPDDDYIDVSDEVIERILEAIRRTMQEQK